MTVVAVVVVNNAVVEANEKPGINVLQCLNGGMRAKIEEKYREILTGYGSKHA